jgi:hypothetical protein
MMEKFREEVGTLITKGKYDAAQKRINEERERQTAPFNRYIQYLQESSSVHVDILDENSEKAYWHNEREYIKSIKADLPDLSQLDDLENKLNEVQGIKPQAKENFYDSLYALMAEKRYAAALLLIDKQKRWHNDNYNNELQGWINRVGSSPYLADFAHDNLSASAEIRYKHLKPLEELETMVNQTINGQLKEDQLLAKVKTEYVGN